MAKIMAANFIQAKSYLRGVEPHKQLKIKETFMNKILMSPIRQFG
jgi:hypothetical protein